MANFMKSKIFLGLIIVSLGAFIIGGVTMAWFTDEADIQAAEFKAGTVKINAGEDPEINVPKGKSFNNVNPGDCATIIWEFVNEGTKAVQLKVKLNELWSDSDLDVDNVYYCPVEMKNGKGWVMADDEDGETWLYYIDKSSGALGSIRGTYNAEDPTDPLTPETVELKLVVVFDVEGIDNEYQGETYTLGGENEGGDPSIVSAIQSSNNAPETQWDEWTDVIADNYMPEAGTGAGNNYGYFHTGPGALSYCWLKAHGQDPIDPDKLYVTINYLPGDAHYQEREQWDEGEAVSLTAPTIQGYEFDEWDVPSELGATQSGNNLQFVMPDHHVGVTAKYTKKIVVKDFKIKDIGASKGKDGYYTTVNGTIYDLIDTNDQPISGTQLSNVKAKVVAMLDSGSKEEDINITFDSNGVGKFKIKVPGVWTDRDNTTSVTVTIGGVTRTAKGD